MVEIFRSFQLDSQYLSHQKFQNMTVFTGAWKKAVTIHQSSFLQIFRVSIRQNFSLSKFCATSGEVKV